MLIFALALGFGSVLIFSVAGGGAAESKNQPVDFEREVAPVLLRHCAGCHNPSDKAGGLSLATRDSAFGRGKSGETAIKPGDVDESYIITRIEAAEMPPAGKGKPLDSAELATLKHWIDSGAVWPVGRKLDLLEFTTASRAGRDWWSLRPLSTTPPPVVNNQKTPKNPSPISSPAAGAIINPIDAFVLAKLDKKHLSSAPPAAKRTLLRRVTFDLIGLPPTPEEIAAFLADDSPQAYEHVVDRLLASPHYGERWARHWLDIVHFGESQGFERDKPRNNAFRYRDWVIAAFNADMPYDEFVRLQLAGDVLRPNDPEAVVATGFLVAGPWDEVGQTQQSEAMKAVVREDEMEDLVATTSQTFLGLTANCARCHDHKFDPISQVDYYRLRLDASAGCATAIAKAGTRREKRPPTLVAKHWMPQPVRPSNKSPRLSSPCDSGSPRATEICIPLSPRSRSPAGISRRACAINSAICTVRRKAMPRSLPGDCISTGAIAMSPRCLSVNHSTQKRSKFGSRSTTCNSAAAER